MRKNILALTVFVMSIFVSTMVNAQETPILEEVYVNTSNIESRETVEEFLTLLAQQGITQIAEEVRSLRPGGVFNGIYILAYSGNQIAVALSGYRTIYDGTQPTGRVSYCQIVYKPIPSVSVSIHSNMLVGDVPIGFTMIEGEFYLVIRPEHETAKIFNSDGTIHSYVRYVIPIEVPDGWTQAASNPNYAFRIWYERVGQYYRKTLQLLDLNTEETQDLTSAMMPYSSLADTYDVSPGDDPVVIFGHNAGIGNDNYNVVLRRVSDPNEYITLDGSLRSINFNVADNTVTIQISATEVVTIDLETLEEVSDPEPQPLSVTLYEPGYDYEIIREFLNNSEFQSTADTIIDNEGNLYVHEFEDSSDILKIDSTDGNVTRFARVHTGMDWRPISQMAFDNINGVLYVIVHYSGADKHLIKITGFTPLAETPAIQDLIDSIEAIPGPQGPQGEPGLQGPQGEPGIAPDEVVQMQSQITELQQQNQSIRNLVNRIRSLPPIRWWLRRRRPWRLRRR